MNEEIKNEEKRPDTWQQVRDYFRHLDDADHYRQHIVAWAQDFVSYYESRDWTNKHGAITKWRPVASAWFRRNAEKVPKRAVKRVDHDALRRDFKWHERRRDNYLEAGKRDLALKETKAMIAIHRQLNNEA